MDIYMYQKFTKLYTLNMCILLYINYTFISCKKVIRFRAKKIIANAVGLTEYSFQFSSLFLSSLQKLQILNAYFSRFTARSLKVHKIFLNLWNPFSFPIAILHWSSLYKSYKRRAALVLWGWLSGHWNLHWRFFLFTFSSFILSFRCSPWGVLNNLQSCTDLLFPRISTFSLSALKDDRVQYFHFDRWRNWAMKRWKDLHMVS